MPIIDITAPAVEPISAADVKPSARIDGTEFDSQIALIIPSLRRNVEGRLNRRLINQTVELVIDAFPVCEIDLVLPDVSEIVSVKYIDESGAEKTLAETAYYVDNVSTTSWLMPAADSDWPATMSSANAVRIRFVTGFGAAAENVPEDIRLWMIAHAVQIIKNPDGLAGGMQTMPFIDGLLDQYKVWKIA